MIAMPLRTNETYWTAHEPASDYHAVDAVSSSGVNLLLKSSRLYEARYILGQRIDEDKDTKALDIGTAGHGWVLEPDAFPDCVAIAPPEVLSSDGKLTTKAGKEWKSQQGGRVILKEEEWERVKRMRRALHAHKIAHALIENAIAKELSIYWKCPATGLPRKSRLDLLTHYNGHSFVADLKTASDHTRDAFGKAMHTYGYARQAAFYLQAAAAAGFGPRKFAFIVVQSRPPFVVRVYEPDAAAMELAHKQLAEALYELSRRYRDANWAEDGEHEIMEAELPTWAFPKER